MENATRADYQRVWVVYGFIQDKAGRVLLVKNEGRYWSLPGGRVEAGETLGEALTREVREECGLSVQPAGLAALNEALLPKVGRQVLFFTFHCQVTGDIKAADAFVPNSEITAVQWFSLEEANEMLPYYEGKLSAIARDIAPYILEHKTPTEEEQMLFFGEEHD